MRYFSAQYVFTNAGPPLKRPVITTDDEGIIISVEDTSGNLGERHSVRFFNGIIVPGFVNSHCHLELSWMKGTIRGGKGLGSFLEMLNLTRSTTVTDVPGESEKADRQMSDEGVVICADICNTATTFPVKKNSRIKYINLLEVYGINPGKAGKRMEEMLAVAEAAGQYGLEWYLVPHSAYSVSLPLFRLLKERSLSNRVTSVHFMESPEEKSLLSEKSGNLMEAYRKLLMPDSRPHTVKDHITAVSEEVTPSGNLILVHNTFITVAEISGLRKRKGLFYCLCPNSNLFIEGKMPPVRLLHEEGCDIVIGTDGLSSNSQLSMVAELRTLQEECFPISLEEMIKWATINGARALGAEQEAGSIEPGKRPGLVLIRNLDLENLRLLPSSRAERVI